MNRSRRLRVVSSPSTLPEPAFTITSIAGFIIGVYRKLSSRKMCRFPEAEFEDVGAIDRRVIKIREIVRDAPFDSPDHLHTSLPRLLLRVLASCSPRDCSSWMRRPS